jgi:hypothetical protein
MPVEGFDDASKSINKKKKERKRGFPGLQGVSEAVGGFVDTVGNTLIYQRRQENRRKKADAKAKQAEKPATTQESLLNIKNEFVGFKPFEEANKSGNITKTITPKVKAKVKAKVKPKVKPLEVKVKKAIEIKTTPAKAPKLVNTTLQPSTPKTEEKAYQKKGTMGKGKAPRIKAKPKKRAAKGSRAATLKKGFGY